MNDISVETKIISEEKFIVGGVDIFVIVAKIIIIEVVGEDRIIIFVSIRLRVFVFW